MADQQQYEQQQYEQQQYEQQQLEAQQQQQYYPAFTSQDGYQVPGGVFHAPNVLQVPGQSFVGPPLQLVDNQPLLAAPQQFQAAPLQIGIPGGFQFMPSMEQQYHYYPETASTEPIFETEEPASSFGVRTRDACVTSKKGGAKGCFAACFK